MKSLEIFFDNLLIACQFPIRLIVFLFDEEKLINKNNPINFISLYFRSWSNSNFKQQTSDELASMSFIDGLGKGQMISRQGLASPYLGDIQLSLCDRRGNLEIEVIRARNLQAKTNKILPRKYKSDLSS